MSREPGPLIMDARIPGYELLSPAGRGSMGRVFVAKQVALGRLVALKFLAVDPDADPEERRARFRREAAIMAALSHNHVLPIFDYGEQDDRPYLVMEYVEGGDLRRRMPEGKAMPADQVLKVLMPVGEALDYLHRRGILHRDLKPENILMFDDETPKVADFGIAVERTGSGELTHSGQGLGTLGYVAPEQQYRLPVDERADQYSLAAMTYEMLTGQRPLGVFKRPSHYNPKVSKETDAAVLKGLQEDPGDRYPSVIAFCRAVERALEPSISKRRDGSSRIGLAGSAVMAGVAVCAAAFSWISVYREPGGTNPEFVAAKLTPPTRRPDVPPPPPEPVEEAAAPIPDRGTSQRYRDLTGYLAHEIWQEMGAPSQTGELLEKSNWYEAEAYLKDILNERAYAIYQARGGRPGEDDEAKSLQDWDAAERALAKELNIGESSDRAK